MPCIKCKASLKFKIRIDDYEFEKSRNKKYLLHCIESYISENIEGFRALLSQLEDDVYKDYDLTDHQQVHDLLDSVIVINGALICLACNEVFDIVDKIPIMLEDKRIKSKL